MCFAQTDSIGKPLKRLAALRLCHELGYKVKTPNEAIDLFRQTYITVSPSPRPPPTGVAPGIRLPPPAPAAPPEAPPPEAPPPAPPTMGQGPTSAEVFRQFVRGLDPAAVEILRAELLGGTSTQAVQPAVPDPPTARAAPQVETAPAHRPPNVSVAGGGGAGKQSAPPLPPAPPAAGQTHGGSSSSCVPPHPMGGSGGPSAQARGLVDAAHPGTQGGVQSAGVLAPWQRENPANPPGSLGGPRATSVFPPWLREIRANPRVSLGNPPAPAAVPPWLTEMGAKPPGSLGNLPATGAPPPWLTGNPANPHASLGGPAGTGPVPLAHSAGSVGSGVLPPWLREKPTNPPGSMGDPLASGGHPQTYDTQSAVGDAHPQGHLAAPVGTQAVHVSGGVGAGGNAMGYQYGVPAVLSPPRAVWSSTLDAKVAETEKGAEVAKKLPDANKVLEIARKAARLIEAKAAAAKQRPEEEVRLHMRAAAR